MIYNLNSHKFIKCEKCVTLWGYEEKDLQIATYNSHDIFNSNDFTRIEKYFTCPNCGIAVIVSKDVKVR